MEAPLGLTAGNAIEVEESLEVLSGGGPQDVVDLTVALADDWLATTARTGGERLPLSSPTAGVPSTVTCTIGESVVRRAMTTVSPATMRRRPVSWCGRAALLGPLATMVS